LVKYLFVIFFLLTEFSFAGTIDPSTPDNKYIEYAKQFSSVGILKGKSEKGYDYFASAVAIDSHHVLTAAHVVKDCQTCFFLIEDSKYFVNKINYSKKYRTDLVYSGTNSFFIK
jgi:V8-like Glu-specific endopeptidase